jgi:hypothetical protein
MWACAATAAAALASAAVAATVAAAIAAAAGIVITVARLAEMSNLRPHNIKSVLSANLKYVHITTGHYYGSLAYMLCVNI